jgi:hypothetical protein
MKGDYPGWGITKDLEQTFRRSPTIGKNGIDMIIVRLLGGLGNQMFQYALGRTLSFLRRETSSDPFSCDQT